MEPFAPDPQLDQALGFLEGVEAEGADIDALLSTFLEADSLSDQATRPEAPIPGETDSLRIELPPEQMDLIAGETCDLISEYDIAMRNRVEREDEIRDNYDMVPDPASGGRGPEAAQMKSEMTMSFTDQAAARIVTGVFGITPLIRCDAIETVGFEGQEANEAAKSAEQFLQSYALYGPPKLQFTLPVALLRTTKVGTSVLYAKWADETKRRRHYIPGKQDPVTTKRPEGKIKVDLVDNADVVLWPPTVIDWQDAQFVGHRARHTPQSWRALAKRYALPPDLVSLISATPSDTDEKVEDDLRRQGVEAAALLDRKELQPVTLTELWGDVVIPGDDEPTPVQMILHEPTRKLLYLGHNPHFTQKKPYFPIRYKWSDESGWGTGVGNEVLFSQAADDSMWCLELDNLLAGAYYVVLRRAGSMYNTQTDEMRPGAQIVVDDVEADFKSLKVGGEAPELGASRFNNYTRARSGSGLSSVASGQGDPVMKSGAGTGSVLALIEQGDKKLRQIDANIRTDLSQLYMFFLDLVAQYGPDGVFYQYVSEKDAKNLQLLKYTPPRGEMSQMFRLRAQAPALGASDEGRKDRVMVLANLAQAHVQLIDQQVTDLLSQNNPAAIPRWKEQVIAYLTAIHHEAVRLNEIPAIPEMVPQMPELTPVDEQMNALMAENQQLASQLEMLQQQLVQLTQAGVDMAGEGQPGGTPMEQSMPPPGGMPMMQQGGADVVA